MEEKYKTLINCNTFQICFAVNPPPRRQQLWKICTENFFDKSRTIDLSVKNVTITLFST